MSKNTERSSQSLENYFPRPLKQYLQESQARWRQYIIKWGVAKTFAQYWSCTFIILYIYFVVIKKEEQQPTKVCIVIIIITLVFSYMIKFVKKWLWSNTLFHNAKGQLTALFNY